MKYISPFVMRMKQIDSRNKQFWLWDSTKKGTYVNKKHGELLQCQINQKK